MSMRDQLSKWLSDQGSGPERKKLAERLLKDADDEDTAALVNRVIDTIMNGGKEK